MTATAAGLGLFALLMYLPVVVDGRRDVSPRLAAGGHLVSLLGWGLLAVVWLGCVGASIGAWLAGIPAPGGGCLLGLERAQWLLLGYLPAAAALGLLAWHVVHLAVAARRAELRGLALAGSAPRAVSGGMAVWVVPSQRPAAYAGGVWRPRAVVTSGLLAPLEDGERQAVCEHEGAHIRLGHPRVLVVGGAVAAALGWFGPVRRAWDGLRRELEAAADDEAARVVGAATVISALAHVVLAGVSVDGGTAAFGELEHLRWRITRLEQPHPVRAASTAVAGSAVAVVAAAMAWTACVLAEGHPTVVAVGFCVAVLAAAALRPVWAWNRRLQGH